MKKLLFLFFSIIAVQNISAQEAFQEKDITVNKFIDGTLTTPAAGQARSLVIFVQGSGPTDRNGNQPMMKSDFAKKIAHQLAGNDIASFRFDKRIFKMKELDIKEKDLRFEDFVTDIESVISYFRKEGKYENIIVAGHSAGSLQGILAAKDNADAFISLAGAGESIDKIIVGQIAKQAPGLKENTQQAFDELIATGSTSSYNPMLQSIFRPSVQPYMASWIKYDPAQEMAKLDIPVLIVNGTADIQVSPEEAKMLEKADPDAKLVIIEDMNHVFRKVESDDALENTKTYNEPNRPLHPELIPVLTDFIKAQEK